MMRRDGVRDDNIFVSLVHVNVAKLVNLIITRVSFNIHPEGLTFSTIRNMVTSMVGNKRDLIFSTIDIFDEFRVELGPNRARQVCWLWDTFNEFCEDLPYYDDEIQAICRRNPAANLNELQARMIYADELEARNKYWCRVFSQVYDKCDVTPYIHRFAMHLPNSYRRHGDVFLFHNEGFECSNKIAKTRYEQSNNKIRRVNTPKFLKPLLQKSLRCSYYSKLANYKYNRFGKKIMKEANNVQLEAEQNA